MDNTNKNTIFWASIALLSVLLTVIAAVGAEALGLSLGHKNWGRFGGDAVFPCLLVAFAIVYGAFHRLGLVKGEQDVETLWRDPNAGSLDLDARAEMRLPRSLWLTLAGTMDAVALLFFVMVTLLPAVPGTKPDGYGIAAFFALFSLLPWYGYATHAGLIASVDNKSLRCDSGKPKPLVRWSEIASCEITLVPQPWGHFTRYTFRDGMDKVLMRLILSAAGVEQERFISAFRRYFD